LVVEADIGVMGVAFAMDAGPLGALTGGRMDAGPDGGARGFAERLIGVMGVASLPLDLGMAMEMGLGGKL
jgi:hypothetical protein